MCVALISQYAPLGFLIPHSDFIKHLVELDHEVYGFASDFTNESKVAVVELGAIPVEYSLNKTGMNTVRDLKDTWSLTRKLKLIAPDVVFSFFVKPSIYGALVEKLAGVQRLTAMLEEISFKSEYC